VGGVEVLIMMAQIIPLQPVRCIGCAGFESSPTPALPEAAAPSTFVACSSLESARTAPES
jgi:hypothetical protein